MVVHRSPELRRRLRVVFFGLDNGYARNALRSLQFGHDVLAVYSDTPPGRGKRPASERIRSLAVEIVRRQFPGLSESLPTLSADLQIPFRQVETVNDASIVREIGALRPQLICIAGFNRLLKQPILDVPELGTINAHAALLPDFRGPNTFFWMVKQDVRLGGVTLHWTNAQTDAGEILAQRTLPLYPGLREIEYYRALSVLCAEAFHTTLQVIATGATPETIPNGATTTPICRNPRAEDLLLSGVPSIDHALWFADMASRYGTPAFEALGGPVRRLSRAPLAGAMEGRLRDGVVWYA